MLPPISYGAGEQNRTAVCSLEGYCSATELHPRLSVCFFSMLYSIDVYKLFRIIDAA